MPQTRVAGESGGRTGERRPSVSSYRRKLLRWFRRNGRTFPWRERRDRYAVLVGEILLQRTRGEAVAGAYETFLRRWPTYEHLARARPSSVAAVVGRLGLAKRADFLVRLGRELSRRGGVPGDPEELAALPGVGPYVAHAVAVFADGRRLPLVDWVIARVLRRYFGLPGGRRPNADRELWSLAAELVRAGRAREVWLATLDLAAAVCKPRPLCPLCPLGSECTFARTPSDAG
ncbi:MAG TPA: A/G-specific adenine glycosylase [Actinomycetota bacterium]|nr:A/G-specific adenine glycosylase [Actinomycetota bacterium]